MSTSEPLFFSHTPPPAYAHLNPRPAAVPSYAAVSKTLRKALGGQPLNHQDGINLFATPDLVELGFVADEINQKINGTDVFFNVNRHINPTNVCDLSCKFCAFSAKPGDAHAYTYSDDDIATRARNAVQSGATEIHMVGGLHPRWTLKNYIHIIQVVKNVAPQVHIKAFTAVEINWLARRERKSPQEILLSLKEAGLGSMPGGGAEVFAPYVRDFVCDTKLSADGWLDIHRTAHGLGLRSNATLLYGHVEDIDARVDHLLRLRELQEETEGFLAFIPLAYQPENNELSINKATYGVDDLKTIAVARILLNNFRNIKAYWIMLGEKSAQAALNFGANDIDGTVVEEKIANMAGTTAGQALAKQRILRLIRAADRVPVERNTTYEAVRRYDHPHEDFQNGEQLATPHEPATSEVRHA